MGRSQPGAAVGVAGSEEAVSVIKMDFEGARRYQIFTQICLMVGSIFPLYVGHAHSQSYGLTDVFAVTVAVTIPVGIALGIIVVRYFDAILDRGELPDRKVIIRGPYYIHTWIVLIATSALIVGIVFFYQRFSGVEAFEAWYLNPHQRTPASVANAILLTMWGVLWIVVPGFELVWWVLRGKQSAPPAGRLGES